MKSLCFAEKRIDNQSLKRLVDKLSIFTAPYVTMTSCNLDFSCKCMFFRSGFFLPVFVF